VLADSLSLARILLVAPLSVLAITGHGRLVGVGLLLGGLTDVLDGRVARGYGGATRRGARLDAIADTSLLFAAAAWVAILYPAVLREGALLLITGAAYVSGSVVSVVTTGRMVDPRRLAPKIAGGLLYLFALSGLTRAILATLLAKRIREFRKPRRTLSAPALVMRVTGFNAMLGLIYDFIGRIPPSGDDDEERR